MTTSVLSRGKARVPCGPQEPGPDGNAAHPKARRKVCPAGSGWSQGPGSCSRAGTPAPEGGVLPSAPIPTEPGGSCALAWAREGCGRPRGQSHGEPPTRTAALGAQPSGGPGQLSSGRFQGQISALRAPGCLLPFLPEPGGAEVMARPPPSARFLPWRHLHDPDRTP